MLQRMPTQQELLLPILEVLGDRGPMQARDVCDAVAERLKVSPDVRKLESRFKNGSISNLFDRKVRWTRQNAVEEGFIPKGKRGVWDLTDRGHETLTKANPGVAFIVARTDDGLVMWAEAMTAMGYIDDGSLQLIFTSPPYPLNRQRAYGGWGPDRYVDTFMEHIDQMVPLLTHDGSMVINLCDVYDRGVPALNTYQEELVVRLKQKGLYLAGKEVWVNPSKPRTTPWVTQKRERIVNGFETFYWWAPTPHPKANNRNVLDGYSERFIEDLKRGGHVAKAISGSRQAHPGKARFAVDNGGSIPFNVTVCGSDPVTKHYKQYCESRGLPLHPARMPKKLIKKYVALTTDVGDKVYDPFGGSLSTLAVCQEMGRECIISEAMLEYAHGGCGKLEQLPGYESFMDLYDYRLWPVVR